MKDVCALWDEGRRRWPGIALSREAFSQRIRDAASVRHPADLYLALAAEEGASPAVFELEQILARVATRRAARFALSRDERDDLLQELRCLLLVPPIAKLKTFRGEGPLEGWVTVVATRLLIDRYRRREQAAGTSDGAVSFAAADVLAVKGELRVPVSNALRQALAALTSDERALILHYFKEGLSTAAIGALYGVHKATIARRILAVQARLEQVIAAELAKHRIRRSELASAVRAVLSQVEVA